MKQLCPLVAIYAVVAMSTQAAQAVDIMSFTLESDVQSYLDYVRTCDPSGAGGNTDCGQDGGTLDPDLTLFAWGAQGYDQSTIAPQLRNSVRTKTYTGGAYAQPFTITGIAFSGSGAVGRPLDESDGLAPGDPLYGQTVGVGIASAGYANAGSGLSYSGTDAQGSYQASDAANLQGTQMAATIVRGSGGGSNSTLISNTTVEPDVPASTAPAAVGGTWIGGNYAQIFETSDPTPANGPTSGNAVPYLQQYPPLDLGVPGFQDGVWYVQQPINQSYGLLNAANKTVNPGDSLQFRLFTNVSGNSYTVDVNGTPTVVQGPMTVLSSIDAKVQGTQRFANLNLTTPTSVDLGLMRVGSGTSLNTTITVSNNGDAGTTLFDTQFTGPSAPSDFAPIGSSIPTDVLQGTSTSLAYTYQASGIGADSATVTVTGITGETLTQQAVQADPGTVSLSAEGVAPIFALFDFGGSEISGTTINLGDIDIGATVSRQLQIANLFPDRNLGTLTDLTLINTALTPIFGNFNLSGTPIAGSVLGDAVRSDAFTVEFLGSLIAGTFSADLLVYADDGRAFCTDLATCARTEHRFTIMATVTNPAPTPGTLWLLAAAMAGLNLRRQGAGARRNEA